MLYTVSGDPHAKPDNLDKIGELFDIFEDLANPVLVLGDFLETKEVVRARVFNFIYDRIKKSRLHFTILIGNHDWFNLECQDHSLRALEMLPNVTLVSEPLWLEAKGILMVPYIHDLNKFRETLKAYPQAKTLIMHQGVTGFDYGNGFIAEDEIDPAELNRFDLVISGHFHKRQERGNLIYPGTPFSHSFGESNQGKYLCTFDTDTNEVEFMPTPFPEHLTYDFDCDDPKKAQQLENYAFNNTSNYLRVVLCGTQENINAIDKTKFPNVKFIEKATAQLETTTQVLETDSNEAKFQKWATEIKDLDAETIKLGIQLLRGDL